MPGVAGDRHGGRSPARWPPRSTEPPARGRRRRWTWPRRPSPRVYAAVREDRYDVVHNHAFDAPAVSARDRAARAGSAHASPAPGRGGRRRAARRRSRPTEPRRSPAYPLYQASAWRRVVPVDAILPPYVPTRLIRWSPSAGDRAVFAGRLSPEKGAAEAIEIAQAAGVGIDVYGDSYDADTPGNGSTRDAPSRASRFIQAFRERLSGR